MKRNKLLLALTVFMVLSFTLTSGILAYQPIYDQMDDIRWFAGYDPEKGLSLMEDTADGVKLKFKYHTDMWANRVVAGYQYNLKEIDPLNVGVTADKEGVYLRFQDLKWDVPKATLSVPEPHTSFMISITGSEGGWSDGRAVMFWIIRDKENKNKIAVLRGREANETSGMTPEESTANFWIKDYTYLEETIGNELNFYLRKTSKNQWTLNINNNKITLDDKTEFSERFIDMSDLHVSIGTWSSATSVEITITDIWSYGAIEYSKKVSGKNVINPRPSFVQAIIDKEAGANKPTTAPSPGQGSNSVVSATPTEQASQDQSGQTSVDISQDPDIDEDSQYESSGQDSKIEESQDEISDSTQESIDELSSDVLNSSTESKNEDKGDSNTLMWVLISLIVLVVVGGALGFYFLFMKKK